MLSELEKRYPGLKDKIFNRFYFNVNPSYISLIGLAFAIASGFIFSRNIFVLGAFLVGANGFMDVLDGAIARRRNPSLKGDLIDHTIDRLSDMAIIIGISFSDAISFQLGIFAAVSILLVSYMGMKSQALAKRRIYSGVMGRADRIVILFFACLISSIYFRAIYYAVWIIIIFSVITFTQRFLKLFIKLDKGI